MTDIYFVVAFSGLLLLMVLGVCFAILARFGIVHLRTLQIVIAAAALILIIDVVVASIRTRSDRRTSVTVDAIEHRGWWELRYGSVITANELHLPVGTPVLVRFAFLSRSILTFDGLDPVRNRFAGRFANVVITAPRKDEFFARRLSVRGSQRLMIVAEKTFDRWLAQEARPANTVQPHGIAVFLSARCVFCHTIRGVAKGEMPLGPDLTHIASRRTLGNGVVPNRAGYLAGWVVDPPTLKPETEMPTNAIDPRDLHDLLSFLQQLK